jgi:hypothetical protein
MPIPGRWVGAGSAIFQMLHSNFIIIGTLIAAAGSVKYLIETVNGRVKPNRVTFLLWSVIPFIAFFAQIEQGVGLEALMTFSSGFLPLTIFIGSFLNRQAVWKLTGFDWGCGVLSVAGLVLWMLTKVGDIAILFSIIADALAAVPTIVKAYRHPHTEIAWPWIATVIGVVLTLLTLSEFTFANCGFIVYILTVNTLIYALVQFRPGEKFQSKTIDSNK